MIAVQRVADVQEVDHVFVVDHRDAGRVVHVNRLSVERIGCAQRRVPNVAETGCAVEPLDVLGLEHLIDQSVPLLDVKHAVERDSAGGIGLRADPIRGQRDSLTGDREAMGERPVSRCFALGERALGPRLGDLRAAIVLRLVDVLEPWIGHWTPREAVERTATWTPAGQGAADNASRIMSSSHESPHPAARVVSAVSGCSQPATRPQDV